MKPKSRACWSGPALFCEPCKKVRITAARHSLLLSSTVELRYTELMNETNWSQKKSEALQLMVEITREILSQCENHQNKNWYDLLQKRAQAFQEFQKCDVHLKMSEQPLAESWIDQLNLLQKLDQQIEDNLQIVQERIRANVTEKINAEGLPGATNLKLPFELLKSKIRES